MNEIKQDKKVVSWVLGSIAGIGVGVVAWLAVIIVSVYFPHSVRASVFFLSFLISPIIAGLTSLWVSKNVKISVVTGVLTIAVDFLVLVGMAAMPPV